MFTNLLITLFLMGIISAFTAVIVARWRWMPVILLPILFYVPRQAVPGGVLENYIILRWITVLIIPVAVFIQFIKMTVRGQSLKGSWLLLYLVAYVACNIFSGLMNGTNAVELVGSLILYVRYPLLFITFLNLGIKDDVMKAFIGLFIMLVAFQIPECIFRFGVIGIHGDHISWTLGPWGAFDLGVYGIYTIALVLAYDAVKGIKLHHMIFCFLMLAVALFGEIKALVLSVPIVSVVTIYAAQKSKDIKKNIMVIAMPIVLIITAFYMFSVWGEIHKSSENAFGLHVQKITNILIKPSLLFEAEDLDKSSSRIFGSVFIWNYLKQDWRRMLFGAGPGSMLAGNFLGKTGEIYEIPQYLNQISVTMGETGIVGLAVFLGILVSLLITIIRINKTVTEDGVRILSAALISMWMYYTVLGPFYDLVWRHDSPNFIFWFLSAYLFNHRNLQANATGNNQFHDKLNSKQL